MDIQQDNPKYRAGEAALLEIPTNAQVVVFGAGSTVQEALRAFYNAQQEGRFPNIKVACGSDGTEKFAREELDLTVVPTDQLVKGTYLYIDGADQIDINKYLIKGGFKGTGNPGIEGCMYREKLLAYQAARFIVIADDSKLVSYLGENNYGLPVEFKPENEQEVKTFLENMFKVKNLVPRIGKVRETEIVGETETEIVSESQAETTTETEVFVTENGCRIYDVPFDGKNYKLIDLEKKLMQQEGILSTGLFAERKPEKIIIAAPVGIKVY